MESSHEASPCQMPVGLLAVLLPSEPCPKPNGGHKQLLLAEAVHKQQIACNAQSNKLHTAQSQDLLAL